MNDKRIKIRKSFAVLALALALVLGGLAGSLAAPSAGQSPPVFKVSASEPVVNAASLAEGFHAVVEKAQPAVVNISTTKVVQSRETSPFFSDPLFRDFFRNFGGGFDIPRERRENSLGSGVVVSSDGYILTNDHVVRDATEIVVSLADKREIKAKLVGRDPKTDIAVVKVEDKNLPVLTLGDSSKVRVGDVVLAMGNPFGIGQTVTMGIVSATGRGGLQIEDYEDFIQTDAAINPGNSGGALVNVHGELVGINTAILSRSGGNQGIGFAIPSNMAKDVMEQIVQHGKVVRGWLGVMIQPVTPQVAKVFGLKETHGALVGDVTENSPASRAGVAKGDVIVAINGDTVDDFRELQLKIAKIAPGTKVTLKVIRDGNEREIPVTLGELPEKEETAGIPGGHGSALNGVNVDELTPQVARQLGLPPQTFGVVVMGVDPASPAAEAGLRRGDVIQEVNRNRVTSVAAFERMVQQAGGQPVLLLVNRGGNTQYVVVEPK